MRASNRVRAIGAVLGVVVLGAVGSPTTIGAGMGSELKPGPIDPSVIAPAEQLGKAFAMVAAHIRPCVVSVYTEKTVKLNLPQFAFPFGDDVFRQFFGNQFPIPQDRQPGPREFRGEQHGMGSGMVLDKEGHILTNYHVVRDTDDLKVQLADKRQFEAEVVGVDPKTDVAVVRIKGRIPDDLPAITLGDSDALHVGDLVMAIGAPFGLAQTVTEGIISATGRSGVGVADYEDFLQTDTPINPGNSGGPLVNMRGEVIGMNSAIATGIGQFAGVGFAIPSAMIKTMLPKLIKGEKVVRGQLGVMIQNVSKDLATQFKLSEPKGALVAQVNKDSPAEAAGIKAGDVIVRYDGRDVEDSGNLRNLVSGTAPGAKVKIDIVRDGGKQTVSATIATQIGEAAAAAPPEEGATMLSNLGLSVQTLTPDLARQLGVRAENGVVITDVTEGSAASLAGLQKGDVIVETARQPVANVEDLDRLLPKGKGNVLFLVRRQDASLFVVLQPK